jgi:hypothetical protein
MLEEVTIQGTLMMVVGAFNLVGSGAHHTAMIEAVGEGIVVMKQFGMTGGWTGLGIIGAGAVIRLLVDRQTLVQ